MKCKTCQHAIKLHKHPLNRMFNGAISEQVDFLGCTADGKNNGVIVDRVVEECEGWIGKPTMKASELKSRIKTDGGGYWFSCAGISCYENTCIIYNQNDCKDDYNWQTIAAHDFDKTEVTIEDLEQFKIK